MKRALIGLFSAAAVVLPSLPAGAEVGAGTHNPPVAHVAPKKVAIAPADEYFGRMKMSILGIRNEIHDLGLQIDTQPAKVESVLSMANLTEDALADWQKKYPQDPWLPKTLFALERMYAKAPWSDEFNARAKRVMSMLVARYGATWYGREGKKELADGSVGRHVAAPAPVVAAPVAQPAQPAQGAQPATDAQP